MRAPTAQLRYPHARVLLARTKLAYVHVRNLLNDAKRDRTARVAGYVAVWLPEDFLLLFLREGEVVNAVTASASGVRPISIASALGRIPAEPEFGEICFHEGSPELLACMYHTLVTPSEPFPPDLNAADPRALLPYLRDTVFDGVVEVVDRDAVNYLTLRAGFIDHTFVVDAAGASRNDQLARLFGPPSAKPRARVQAWRGPVTLPAQAPPALVAAYRELVDRLYDELGSYGVPVPSAVGERVRDALAARHPALRHFATGNKPEDPTDDQEHVSAAVAAWVTEMIREAVDGDDEVAANVVKAAARERRHMLHAAGFLSVLPWSVEW